MWKVCITQITFLLELLLVKRVLESGLMAQKFLYEAMLCRLNSELKCKCFSRLRDAKVVKKRTFHKKFSKTKQRKKTRKKLKNAKQVKSN